MSGTGGARRSLASVRSTAGRSAVVLVLPMLVGLLLLLAPPLTPYEDGATCGTPAVWTWAGQGAEEDCASSAGTSVRLGAWLIAPFVLAGSTWVVLTLLDRRKRPHLTTAPGQTRDAV